MTAVPLYSYYGEQVALPGDMVPGMCAVEEEVPTGPVPCRATTKAGRACGGFSSGHDGLCAGHRKQVK